MHTDDPLAPKQAAAEQPSGANPAAATPSSPDTPSAPATPAAGAKYVTGKSAAEPSAGAASIGRKGRGRKGIYALPNMVTLAALFGGFYAIVMAFNGRFEQAVLGVLAAIVLDGLDGRIARLTNTQSAFGEQMDSLSDMVSFGAAPALISYVWALKDIGRWGWIAAFVYVACAALRLARFNVNTAAVDKRYFQGLPSPAAAALVIGFLWLVDDSHIQPRNVSWAMFALVLYTGITMVTNAPFYSFKDLQVKQSVPFAVLIGSVLFISAIATDPPTGIFIVFSLYGVSGYLLYAWRRLTGQQTSVFSTSTSEPEERGLHEE